VVGCGVGVGVEDRGAGVGEGPTEAWDFVVEWHGLVSQSNTRTMRVYDSQV
jgi:hypothetical protein